MKKRNIIVISLLLIAIISIILFTLFNNSNNKNNINNSEKNNEVKFGKYNISKEWYIVKDISNDNKIFYLKNGTSLKTITSSISVESNANQFSLKDYNDFKNEITTQLEKQVTYSSEKPKLTSDGEKTKNGYPIFIFTIEDKVRNITIKQYYIVGEYKYILIVETDFHNKDISDINKVAEEIVSSFKW